MNFYVGQKVIFIGDGVFRTFRTYGMSVPEYRKTYTVRAIPEESACAHCNRPGLLLCEIVNPPFQWNEGFTECGFCPSEFRPLVERKTDISIFQKMLTGERVGA